MEKFVRLMVHDGGKLDIDQINPFQGELVEMSPESRAKLRIEILTTGFAFTPHVWFSKADEKYYLLDGHQRISVLKDLRAEGYDIPSIPINIVEAPSEKDAKRRILQARSQYGQMTVQGLYDFTVLNDISIQDIHSSFDFPSIDMAKFDSFFSKPSEDVNRKSAEGSQEIGEDQFSHLIHTCPECGHRFGKGE